jgi:hypothetical protein
MENRVPLPFVRPELAGRHAPKLPPRISSHCRSERCINAPLIPSTQQPEQPCRRITAVGSQRGEQLDIRATLTQSQCHLLGKMRGMQMGNSYHFFWNFPALSPSP